MKFNSAQEIYDVIESGIDLYFTESNIYTFLYSDRGSIAYYYIDEDQLRELARQVDPDNYIGSALGPGGYIIDPDIKLSNGEIVEYDTPEYWKLEDQYPRKDWNYDFTYIYDFLDRFVDEECIEAMPKDLI